jgi:hypothetical protein
VNGDCVIDHLTGLMWVGTPPNGAYTWQNGLAYANGLNATNLCGYNSGWRLPNILELESLVNLGQAGSATWLTRPENGFVGIAANKYWSSTTASSAKNMAWFIDFADDSRDLSVKSFSFLAWPVRGETTTSPAQPWETGQTECYNESGDSITCANTGQDGEVRAGVTWPSPRFTDLGNETVRDNLTGLLWTADANTPGPTTCTPGVPKSSYESYPFIQCLNDNYHLGHSDWRLPNRRELESLLDHSQSSPALPSGHPFSIAAPGVYWTSDTYISLCSSGWAVNMNSGQATEFDKSISTLAVWPVRGPLAMKVLLDGDGSGVVIGAGISCNGNRCLGVYNSGEAITVTTESSTDSVFGGWTGCPSASGNECAFIINTDITVTVTFLAARSIWKKPSSVDFGKVGVGVVSPQKYVSVKNLNTTNLQVETIGITGNNAAEFILEESCTGAPLPPGGSCSIALSVNAQGYGPRTAELLVTSNDTKVPLVKMKLKAKAMPAKIFVQPKKLSFGEVSTAASAQQQLTVENRGPTPLNISSIATTGDHGGDFPFDPTDCPVLQEGQACTLAITFKPGAVGKRTGTLEVTSDVPKKGLVKVMLKGKGI